MKKATLVWLGMSMWALGALAEGGDALAPSAISPKEPPKAAAGTSAERPKSPRSPDGDTALIPDLKLKGVVIVKERSMVQEAGVPSAAGLVLKDVPFLNAPDFRKLIETQFVGKLLTKNLVQDLEDAIILYCRDHGKVLVDVILVPEQNLENGVIQLWLLEGKVGRLTVKNEGHKWFKDQFILGETHLRPAGPVDSIELNHDLNWLNNNPFRQVDVTFRQGTNLGLTDVQFVVADRLPLRGYVGYEDSGTIPTGEDRLLAGFNWGNAFGLDHQFNYQYATDIDFDLVRAHSASYIAPLPWRHIVTVFGAYVDAKAVFPEQTSSEGSSWQVSGRYTVPLGDVKKYRHEVSGGFDFKRGNNNFLFGGNNLISTSDTDVAQFELGYSGLLPDHYGRTSFGLELYYSPGGLTEFNNDEDMGKLRQGAKEQYFYARLTAERVTRLPWDFSWVLRGWGQVATERLMPSEQLALGGYNTVRGYDERVVLGDQGWIVNNELRTPPLPLGNLLDLPGGRDELQFLAFFDAGSETVVDEMKGADPVNPNKTLCSTGFGLRYTVSRNLSVRFDYGFPLTEKALNQHQSRGHLGVIMSF